MPRQIEFRDELPKSTVLKIVRPELRAQEVAKLTTIATREPVLSRGDPHDPHPHVPGALRR